MHNLHNMNEAQRQAVMHGEGPMLVLAGPGSGKTFTITQRITYLIEHYGVDPSRILVITFTKEAAINMQSRFQYTYSSLLSKCSAGCPVNFGTFHAIFYQMLKRSGYYKTDAILKDSEKKQLIIPLLINYKKQREHTNQDSKIASFEVTEDDVMQCIAAISYFKNTGNLDKATQMLEQSYRTGFYSIFTKYESGREKSGKIDFDDMLYMCLNMLQNDGEVLKYWQHCFQYLLIDEFQDINPIQYKIVKMIAAQKGNIFAVGDDDQSIYGFRGSDPALMKQFMCDYPGCEQVLLDTNYRSKAEIVKASLDVINDNKNRFVKRLQAAQIEPAESMANESIGKRQMPVALRSFGEKSEQYHYMINLFQSIQIQKLCDHAVLFRTNSQMQFFAGMLHSYSIPYVMKEKENCIYNHFIMKDLRAYIRLACGDRSRNLLFRVMNKPDRSIRREVVENEKFEFEELMAYYEMYGIPEHKQEILNNIKKLRNDLSRLQIYKPHLGILYVRKAMGYERYLKRKAGSDAKKLAEWTEILEYLSDEAAGYKNYESWLQYQDDFTDEQNSKKLHRKDQQNKPMEETEIGQGVRLMTVHASKGLEFESVWIPDINEGTFPYGRMLNNDMLEEERRILYVAMTRAKKNLELSYITGTQERPRLPSRFLKALTNVKNYSPSTNSSNSQLSRYSSKASETCSYSSSSSI